MILRVSDLPGQEAVWKTTTKARMRLESFIHTENDGQKLEENLKTKKLSPDRKEKNKGNRFSESS